MSLGVGMRSRAPVRGVAAAAAFLFIAFACAPARAVAIAEFPVAESRLENGLRLLVHEDHRLPVVSSCLLYRVGSADEQIGATGMAHLFEHMMFNGSRGYGAGSFDRLIEGAGGSTNGYTTRDFTVYVNDFPPEALELVLALEADRMAHLLIVDQNLEQERGIVKEERRLRVDDAPLGTMGEQLYLAAFVASPYRWNTVGFMADLDAITLAEAQAFFGRYYTPANATLVLAGDVDARAAGRAVSRLFASVARHAPPLPRSVVEPPQLGQRRVRVGTDAELPAVLIGHHAPAVTAAERAALDVLDMVLSNGESSRLYRRLVYDEALATTVWTDYGWERHPGLFEAYAQARPGVDIDRVERALLTVLSDASRFPPDERELRTAKNTLGAALVRALSTASGKAHLIGWYHELFGDHRALFRIAAEWEAVTPERVAATARALFVARQRTTVVLVPERAR